MSTSKLWCVFYTYPRAEKIANEELIKNSYETFLPTMKTLKVWKNRQKKEIDRVLFPGYIFVNVCMSEIFNVLKMSKIVSYVKYDRKPALIRQSEIDKIKTLIGLSPNISVISDFTINEKVRVISGPLYGYEGILILQKGKTRFGLQINEINQTVFIEVNANIIEKIK